MSTAQEQLGELVTELQEWHDWRQGGIGGSDIAALIGLSRYASPTSLYFEKLGMLEGHEETQRQRIGKRMEAVLAAEFADETGLHAVGEQTWCEHPEYPWARCTADAFAAESPSTPALSAQMVVDTGALLGTVEFKTDGRFAWPEGIPANIRAQVTWQLGVTGLRHAWVVVMFAGFRVEVFEIDWDAETEADWSFMLQAAEEFWLEHVLAQVPPPLDDHEATTDALSEIYRDAEGMLEADDDARRLVAVAQLAQARTKAAKAEEVRACNEVRALLGDRTDLIDGWTQPKRGAPKPIVIASWREQTSHRVDAPALRAAEPELAERFTTTTKARVLRIPAMKENSE